MTLAGDTNVVVSAAFWPKSEDRRCFVLLARRKCRIAVTLAILEEYRIRDRDVIAEGMKQFATGKHRGLDSQKQASFLSYLFPMIGLKCGRSEFRFWANTIDEFDLSEDMLVLKGVCSPHVAA